MHTADAVKLQAIPHAFLPYRQFINWTISGTTKLPCDVNGNVISAHDSQYWLDAQTASASAFGVAFVFTSDDPFFFVDVDSAWDNHTGAWSDLANWTVAQFPGAAVEVSHSGRGLHVFGSGAGVLDPSHGTRRAGLAGLEIYTHGRFVALTGTHRAGDAGTDFSARLPGFLQVCGLRERDMPYEAVAGRDAAYTGPEDDAELIRIMLGSDRSLGQMFGGKATARELWERDVSAMERAFGVGGRPDGLLFDHSSADAALMFHLAFWTGRDQPRMQRLFERSALYRPWKYTGRDVYRMPRVIGVGCRNPKVFDAPKPTIAIKPPALVSPTLTQPTRGYIEGNKTPKTQPELIKRLLPASPGLVSFIAGQSGAGKSFYACALAVALAAGKEFLGMPVRENVGVIIIAAEGAGTIDARIFAAKRAAGMEGKQLAIGILQHCPDIRSEAGFKELTDEIRRLSDEMIDAGLCTRVGAVIIDTLSVAFAIEDENSNSEMVKVVNSMVALGHALQVVVVPVHHFGKNKDTGMRGASSLRGTCDHMVAILGDRDEQTGGVKNRQVAIPRSRSGPEGVLCKFDLKEMNLGTDDYGDPFTTCVFEMITGDNTDVTIKKSIFDECFDHVWATEPKTKVGELEGITDVNVRTEFMRRWPADGQTAKRMAWSRALKNECLTLKNYHTIDGLIFKTVKKRPINFDKLFPNRPGDPVTLSVTCVTDPM